jgi:hypothetical protein
MCQTKKVSTKGPVLGHTQYDTCIDSDVGCGLRFTWAGTHGGVSADFTSELHYCIRDLLHIQSCLDTYHERFLG